MKKPKFLFKIDRNIRGKVYINKKWQKDVVQISILGNPHEYYITIDKYIRDSNGRYVIHSGDIATERKMYELRGKSWGI